MQWSTPRHFVESKLEVSIRFLPSQSGKPIAEVRERLTESQGMEDTTRTWHIESIKPGSHGFTETKEATTRPAWVYTRSSVLG